MLGVEQRDHAGGDGELERHVERVAEADLEARAEPERERVGGRRDGADAAREVRAGERRDGRDGGPQVALVGSPTTSLTLRFDPDPGERGTVVAVGRAPSPGRSRRRGTSRRPGARSRRGARARRRRGACGGRRGRSVALCDRRERLHRAAATASRSTLSRLVPRVGASALRTWDATAAGAPPTSTCGRRRRRSRARRARRRAAPTSDQERDPERAAGGDEPGKIEALAGDPSRERDDDIRRARTGTRSTFDSSPGGHAVPVRRSPARSYGGHRLRRARCLPSSTTSCSSSTPNCSRARRRASAISARQSAVVAPPAFSMKFACFGEMSAPPIR